MAMTERDPSPQEILICSWLLIGVAAALILARLYLRIRIQTRHLMPTDIIMCTAWVVGVISTSFNVALTNLGALDNGVKITLKGYHGSMSNISTILKLYWVWAFMFLTTLYLSKGALLALYYQIFPIFMFKRRIFLRLTIAFAALAYTASVSTHSLICLPVSTVWNLDPAVSCSSAKLQIVFQVAWVLHLFTDVLIFVLPWLILPELKLRTSLKIGVYCSFLLGIINISVAIARFVLIEAAENSNDVSISVIMLFNTVDCNTALIIACLPALRPYFDRNRSDQPRKSSANSGTTDPMVSSN